MIKLRCINTRINSELKNQAGAFFFNNETLLILVLAGFLFFGCQSEPERFTPMSPKKTGVDFVNSLPRRPI